ncbi:MAG: uracil-DNA glycosylase [Cereibacter sphaeroides]|uniref:Type-4 uracil-DNA glycosylase n=1 Tax=Cereibacter sphaeroides TaxID=1063 RepID=A0A2W5S9C2_CERSP|nr:MAG: uracil-DNA glycosylase [Cereibacter sphaeroides]
MDSELEFHAALTALSWQVELGADEALSETAISRYEEKPAAPPTVAVPPRATATEPPRPAPGSADKDAAVRDARQMSAAAQSLDALRDAMAAYDHCELKRGAKNLVFADGRPGARVMIVGEAPGRDEDIEGLPFVGRAGQLLDRMFAAIGLSRRSPDTEHALYITNVMVWRPPQNREPSPQEIAMLLPFLERHIALADPELLIIMGNTPLSALLGTKGITRLRGEWAEVLGRPALPMFHPAYLLRTPSAKREAWADLLSLQARLREK